MGGTFTNSGQVENSGSGTVAALNADVTIRTPGASTIYLVLTGTWVATLTFEATADGTNWAPVFGVNQTTDKATQTATSNDTFGFACGGYLQFRVKATAYTSGTVTVAFNADSNQNPLVAPVFLAGYTDGTPVGNSGSRLLVDTAISSVTGAISASFSSKSRVDLVTTPVNLVTGSYTTVYSYTGSGYLIGYNLEFNNTSILFRMQVDGETVTTNNTLATLGAFQVTANTTDRRQNGQGIVVNGANIDFSFRSPIRFTGSVTLSADANGGVILARQLSQGVVYIVKET